MTRRKERGFTLIELMCVVIVLGTVLAFSIPNILTYTASHNLKGACDNIVGQLRLAREKAIATGTTQYVHFAPNYMGCDYHIHQYPADIVDPKWKLPRNVSFYNYSTTIVFEMTKDGRCNQSGSVILQDHRGRRDTVSVQRSGFVLHH